MKPKSRLIKGILTCLMVAMMLCLGSNLFSAERTLTTVPMAYAAPGDTPAETPAEVQPVDAAAKQTMSTEELTKKAAAMATWSHRLFAPLINYFAFQIGNFLGSDYVYNGAMGKMLQKVWVISRNLVNITFVFLLLWMALKEIFFVNKESELKKNLLKLVLLLIAVNFSWLATKVVLDASTVLTQVVFAIPSGISDPPSYGQCVVNDPQKPVTGTCYPTVIITPTDSGDNPPLYYQDEGDQCAKIQEGYYKEGATDTAYTKEGITNVGVSTDNMKFVGRTSICVENLNLLKYDMNTSVVYLTYGMARIQNLVYAMGGNGDIVQLTVGILLSLLIQIAYTVALFALFVTLIIRMAMLWFFVGFSPFMVLVIWFSEGADYDLGKFKFGFKEFTKWAFAPAKVGAIFAVSFIMISAGQTAGVVKTSIVDNINSKSGMVFKILEIDSLFGGMGGLQSFLWILMSLVILWIGVFAVLSDMNIVNQFSEKINGYGQSVAKLVATAPYWAPVLPLGKGGEKTAIKQLVQGIDVRKKLESYAGVEKQSAEIRRLNDKARDANYTEVLTRANKPGFSGGDANWIAGRYGFNNVQDMMKPENKEAVLAAFRTSKNYEQHQGTEAQLYDALRKASEKTPVERAQEQRDTAAAVTQGVRNAGPGAVPGAATTVAAPSAPPAGPAGPAGPKK